MGKQRNVLFAEDDTDDFYFVEDAFALAAPAVNLLRAHNGGEVVSLLQRLPDGELPVLIILDNQLALVSGLETLRYLNAVMRYEPIPKVIYTGSDYPPYMDACLANGAVAYILNGLTAAENLRNVTQMLAYCR